MKKRCSLGESSSRDETVEKWNGKKSNIISHSLLWRCSSSSSFKKYSLHLILVVLYDSNKRARIRLPLVVYNRFFLEMGGGSRRVKKKKEAISWSAQGA